jgi:predicted site-specific integrase-resolvase
MATSEHVGSKEASEILNVDRATFLRWVDKGVITPVHELAGLRGAKMFLRSDVEKLKLGREKAEAAS